MFPLWGTRLHNHAAPTGIRSNKLLLAKSFLYQLHHNALSSPESLHNSHQKRTKTKNKTPKNNNQEKQHDIALMIRVTFFQAMIILGKYENSTKYRAIHHPFAAKGTIGW